MSTKQLLFLFFTAGLLLLFSCEPLTQNEDGLEETFYLRNNGSDMPVFMRGNETSDVIVVLLHGGPGDSSTAYMRRAFAQQLHQYYTFAYWDQRQQGNSHGHIDTDEVDLDIIVEDLFHVVQALKTRYGSDKRIYLMGHSWGGTVGTAFLQTANYQEEIAGFIEISGGYDFPTINIETVKMMREIGQVEIDAGRNVERWQEIIDYINTLNMEELLSIDESLQLNSYAGDIRREELLDDLYIIPTERDFEDVNVPVSHQTTVMMNGISIFLQKELINKVLTTSLTANLDKINVPTLLIWGKYDFKVPPKLGEIALEQLGSTDKTLKIYEHAAHNPMTYDTDRFVDDVVMFIGE